MLLKYVMYENKAPSIIGCSQINYVINFIPYYKKLIIYRCCVTYLSDLLGVYCIHIFLNLWATYIEVLYTIEGAL